MDEFMQLELAAGWVCFALGCLLTACAVWLIQAAMRDLYYQKLDVLNRIKAQHEKPAA